ncbi:MAG TPA: EAL domain-containing protein [Dehalococcoidia bacterium]|nr:EAL domain-containing protein [Dehalococcoidia bacterium]
MNILLVDDNAGDVRFMEELLRDDEDGQLVALTSCETLDEAMHLLATVKFDAVLLDLGLPGSSGTETLTTVLASGPRVPAIIVTTGSGDRALTRRALRLGAQDYLIKGKFDGEQVARAIRYSIERKRFERELADKAFVDPLTGLPNRTLLIQHITAAISDADRLSHRVGVLFLDLDGFKTVNDILGHSEGDGLLKVVGGELLAKLKPSEVLARFGGDEFVILLQTVQGIEEVTSLAQRVLSVLRKPRWLSGREFLITGSVGVAFYPDHGRDPENLLASADAAMYKAKEAGKDTYRVFGHEVRERLQERLELESGLRGALERGEFVLHYQPKFESGSGRLVGAEALVRWNHPKRGLVLPDEFIPLAEETGIILPLGEWVLRAACNQARAWQKLARGRFRMAVNLSPRQFRQLNLADMINRALQDARLSGDCLELEITEATAMSDVQYAINALNEIRQLGVQIAIDDFGTGYSSLGYLRQLPIDRIKIDKSFIEDIPESTDDAEISAAIIALGHTLRLEVVAEGVQTSEQLAFLRDHECDEVQGYFTGRPVPSEQFVELLISHKR